MKFILQMFGIYYSDGSASDGGDINSFTADPSKAAEVSIKSLVARSKFSAPQREEGLDIHSPDRIFRQRWNHDFFPFCS